MPNQLLSVYDEIHSKCSKLDKAVEFYINYVEYLFQRYLFFFLKSSLKKDLFIKKSRPSNESLTILAHFVKKGNTTVFEWRTGIVPEQVERPKETQLDFGNEESLFCYKT